MSLPYFPMFPSDFEAKTSHLTLAEDGAYNRLLRVCWMTPGCTIPADEAWIMRRVRAHTEAEQEAVKTVLAEYFTVEKGRYSNARLMRVFHDTNDAHEKRKNAGAKGGKSKALKTKGLDPSNAKAMLKQPEPEPEPELVIIDDKSSIISAREKQRGSRIPQDWGASLKDVAYAVSLGLTDGEIAHEENQFRDYWLAKAGSGGVKRDWAAAWRTWCRNQIKFRQEREPRQAVGRREGKRLTGWDRLAGDAGGRASYRMGEGMGDAGGPVIDANGYRFTDG